ncbi:MAG: septum formation inhibitor Maf [Gammaproteobacteria bacterium]|nr:septum formation inhibitor Maf [Gammaproteobacteria bacterium]MBU2479449.1 septum formation inhibitor Maf [Gammaproteobacteria bacterium]
MTLPLVLASTSPYRRELLDRLGLDFTTCSPETDETRLDGETPKELVLRLSEAKARTGATQGGSVLVIGSDQVAVVGDTVLGKPGTTERACAQLAQLSGQRVTFLTGLCLFNSAQQRAQVDLVPFTVVFRKLSTQQIENYVQREQPLNCAGSFKSEGLGAALFERMEGDDPTALIGLPLIRLVSMLEAEGVAVLG